MLLGLVLLLVSLLCACHDGLPERTADTPPPTSTAPASSSTESSARSYVGSQACSACHPEVYSAWRGTSHSYSVLSAAEARRAGYPLPVGASAIRSWSDVSYVIGGRERITYADAAGMVQRESYHHRVTSWDRFPSLPMTTCGPCHFTAFGAGIEHPDDPVLPGKWAERNIGCESCHGPGSQHVASLDPTDIETDYSSRSCGSCHTTVGRVLPEDEWHSTHDLVQTWNRDPHVTGGQFHSQSRFCSRCHAPRDASVLDAQGDAAMPVFSENKDNITCVGCHNPHAVTNPSYAPDTASLAPPLGSSLHAYVGDDGDFTTTDFATFSDREQLCTHCHSGADRIELDHANATCSDCHNTFHSNRDVQSRIDHDANRPRLSCRQCHRDSEYLMSIVFEDPVFLEPKNIHDLTSLPAAAIERYGLRYVRLARAASRPAGLDGEQPNVETPEAPETIEPVLATVRRMEPGPDGALHELVARAADNDPRGATRALHAAARASSTQVLAGMEATTTLTATVRAQIQTAPAADRAWLDGYGALSRGELTEAERWFSLAATAQPDEPSFEFYRGVVELELERVPSATAIFEQLVTTYPSRTPFRVALGVTHLEGKRLLHARQQLDLALQANAEDPVAHYFLARTALAQRDIGRAVEAYQAAVALEPRFMKARYELGRSFRLAGDLASAARIYRELAIDDPEPFEAHVSLANVYKYLSDRNAIQLLHERESRAPTEMTTSQWNTRLAAWDNASEHYAGLALAELAKALQLRPANVELKRQVSEVLRRTGSLERAEAYFRWLARNRPEEWLPRYRLGTILIRRAHYEDAVWQLQQAARAAPAEGDAHAALGLALLEAGDVRAAIAALELATVYSPFDPATHTNLGAAYAMTGELGRAKVSLKRSLELATFPLPRVHLTHTNLALVHLRLDERDEAMQQLQTALHAYPDYEYAKEIAAWLQTSRGDVLDTTAHDFVLNDLLERFGEVTTVVFE